MKEAEGIAGARILSIIERIEQLEEEIKALNEGKKEVFSEAKGEGYDIKVLREILKIRKLDRDERDEQESLIDLYMRAISEAEPEKQAAYTLLNRIIFLRLLEAAAPSLGTAAFVFLRPLSDTKNRPPPTQVNKPETTADTRNDRQGGDPTC